MMFLLRNLFILLLITFFFGCESKNSYDIKSDKIIEDLNSRIKVLQEDLDSLTSELKDVKLVLKDPDIDTSLRQSIRKEIHEGEKYKKDILQWLSFLKVRRKRRYNSLLARKNSASLKDEATKEVRAYFVNKKLKPIARPWLERYRTAIEL